MKKIFTPILLAAVMSTAMVHANDAELITLDLSKPANPTSFTFDADKGFWTETYNEADYTYFSTQSFEFSHLLTGASYGGTTWDGFTVVASGDVTNHNNDELPDWISNQWGCIAGGGIQTAPDGSIVKDASGRIAVDADIPYVLGYYSFYANYVLEQSPTHILFTTDAGYIPQGFYLANSTWSYYTSLEGGDYNRPLNQEGDALTLIVRGMDASYEEMEDNKLEIPLAKFEDGVFHMSKEWNYVDLQSLGLVYGLTFKVESTDADPVYGPNTPCYFCMDKLQVKSMTTGLPTQSVGVTRVYPTRFNERLTVATEGLSMVQLYDANGALVLEAGLQHGENVLDVSMLPAGMYIAQVGTQRFKIVK